MGTAASALVVVAALASAAHATPCTGTTDEGSKFPICFDVGNRLSLTAGSDGFGGGIALRHIIKFDDEPDLVWKMQHQALEVAMFHEGSATVYRGYYIRHARDGHLVFGERKVFLPFDIGALFELGTARWTDTMSATTHLGVVKAAALVDLARSRDFGLRLAIGPIASWDVELTRSPWAVADHVVSPFSSGLVNIHAETSDGLYTGDLRVEAGSAWHTGLELARGRRRGGLARAHPARGQRSSDRAHARRALRVADPRRDRRHRRADRAAPRARPARRVAEVATSRRVRGSWPCRSRCRTCRARSSRPSW